MRPVALISLLTALLLGACSSNLGSTIANLNPLRPYRMEIQQGNFVDQEQVARLQRGMTKDQVRFLLGTPLLTDIFHADRWDYVYRHLPANANRAEERRLTLIFEQDRLARVEGDVVPAGGMTAAAEAQPEPPEPPKRSLFEEGRL
ncbi:MAG: outer membrane protein assembly factor BamE [Burkholderiales bacterium]|nr:outer membrane protein assembly factor BamE [Burkholderiales bacterium]PZN03843.1 MAG: outer membrane protein assembly factor BamE [Pseudomonadota bacterium]